MDVGILYKMLCVKCVILIFVVWCVVWYCVCDVIWCGDFGGVYGDVSSGDVLMMVSVWV